MPSATFRSSRRLVALSATAGAALAGGAYLLTRSSAPVYPSVKLQRDEHGQIVPPKFPKLKSRDEQLADLRRHNGASASDPESVYDLVIVGGGATGTGIALDAATRGLKVALVERGDFASGTSSKSTKLVHGGVRYLEKAVWNLDYGQYKLVCEALRERKTFLNVAPHLSSSLPILIPLYAWWQAPYFWVGTKAYDLLAGSEGLESSYMLGRKSALNAFPLLKQGGLLGGLVYYDGQHNDSRMAVSLALTAALYGATVANYVEVTSMVKDAHGKVCGVRARDALSGKDDFVIKAKGVINATGAFADAIEKMDDAKKQDIVCPSSGIHVTLPGSFSPQKMGLLDANTSDGRVIFFLPWQGRMIAGTTDTPCSIEKDPVAAEKEIEFVLEEVRKNLATDARLTRADVSAAWSGIRPLVRDPNSSNTESLVRNHLITVSDSKLLTCAGGKWTTYREMAQEAVDEAIKVFGLTPKAPQPIDISGMGVEPDTIAQDGSCQTRRVRVVGAHGYTAALPTQLMDKYGFDRETADSLSLNYGDRAWAVAAVATTGAGVAKLSADFPTLEGEIRYAVRNEYAQTASDFLGRRTRIAFLDWRAALDALPRVIDVMAEELSWDGRRATTEWKETVQYLVSMGLPREMAGVTREEVVQEKSVRNEAGQERRPAASVVEGVKGGLVGVAAPASA